VRGQFQHVLHLHGQVIQQQFVLIVGSSFYIYAGTFKIHVGTLFFVQILYSFSLFLLNDRESDSLHILVNRVESFD
jgi:hypothetical protein